MKCKLFHKKSQLNKDVGDLIKLALKERMQAWHDDHENELEAIRWYTACQLACTHGGEMLTKDLAELYLEGIKPVSKWDWEEVVDELMDIFMINEYTGEAQIKQITDLICDIKLFY